MLKVTYLGTNPFFDAYTQSDFLGKCIFISLLFLSILSWVILIHKMRTSRGMKKLSKNFQEEFEKKQAHPLSIQISSSQASPNKTTTNPFSEIYNTLKKQTLELLNKNRLSLLGKDIDEKSLKVYLSSTDIDLLSSYLSTAVSSQIKSIEKNLYMLSTIVTLGPFLGLLGTVWGILVTFSQLHSRAAGQTNEMILSGLSMALGTTVLGLVVAIPAIIAYNYLKNEAREFQSEMEDFSNLILATIELQYRKVDTQ